MFEILVAVLFGAFGGTMVEKQISYCECYRSGFEGKYCQSIKAQEKQGTCHN